MLQLLYLLFSLMNLQTKKRRKDQGEPRFRDSPNFHIKLHLPVGPSTTRQGKDPCRNKCPKCSREGKTKLCTAGKKGHPGTCTHGLMGGGEHEWDPEKSSQ